MKHARELFGEILEDLRPLLFQHREEIDLFSKPLEVDVPTYLSWEGADVSRLYTLRTEEDELVGYALFVLFTHNHHRSRLHATQDVLFVKKEYRGNGLKFIKYCEDQLKKDGVETVHQCVPSCNDWSKVLEFKGYKKLETIYVKDL